MKVQIDVTSTTTSYTNGKVLEYLDKFYGTYFYSDPQFETVNTKKFRILSHSANILYQRYLNTAIGMSCWKILIKYSSVKSMQQTVYLKLELVV